MTELMRIVKRLKRRPLTAMQYLNEFGKMRLAARIEELRGLGYAIRTDMVRQGKSRFAKYVLTENV